MLETKVTNKQLSNFETCAATEINKSLNCNLSSTPPTMNCELLPSICTPPKEAVEHQNKAS